MPLYFFDLQIGDETHVDDTGVEMADIAAVRQALQMTLPRISADRAIKSGAHLHMEMSVRDDGNRAVMAAVLDWSIRDC